LIEKFPVDASKRRVIKAFEILGFTVLKQREHIAMVQNNPDGSKINLTMPGHRRIKGSTLRTICTQAAISREDFLKAYNKT
jgi:predicted RNA binding protein YcfA (HicA-like mRNA interferase family)